MPVSLPGRDFGRRSLDETESSDDEFDAEPRNIGPHALNQRYTSLQQPNLPSPMSHEATFRQPAVPVSLSGRSPHDLPQYQDSADEEDFNFEPNKFKSDKLGNNLDISQAFSQAARFTLPRTFRETADTEQIIDASAAKISISTKEPFIAPDSRDVLKHLIKKIDERHGERYGNYLASHSFDEILNLMETSLLPEALTVLRSRNHTLEK